MVASCIMLDSARKKTLGPAEVVLSGYAQSCDTALDDFCDRHWPCEYVHPNNRGRCMKIKAGHQTEYHQLVSGKRLAAGAYESDFTAEKYGESFRYQISVNLQHLIGAADCHNSLTAPGARKSY
jgi:hypothetical protein